MLIIVESAVMKLWKKRGIKVQLEQLKTLATFYTALCVKAQSERQQNYIKIQPILNALAANCPPSFSLQLPPLYPQ